MSVEHLFIVKFFEDGVIVGKLEIHLFGDGYEWTVLKEGGSYLASGIENSFLTAYNDGMDEARKRLIPRRPLDQLVQSTFDFVNGKYE